jgi:hypothetical protein
VQRFGAMDPNEVAEIQRRAGIPNIDLIDSEGRR